MNLHAALIQMQGLAGPSEAHGGNQGPTFQYLPPVLPVISAAQPCGSRPYDVQGLLLP